MAQPPGIHSMEVTQKKGTLPNPRMSHHLKEAVQHKTIKSDYSNSGNNRGNDKQKIVDGKVETAEDFQNIDLVNVKQEKVTVDDHSNLDCCQDNVDVTVKIEMAEDDLQNIHQHEQEKDALKIETTVIVKQEQVAEEYETAEHNLIDQDSNAVETGITQNMPMAGTNVGFDQANVKQEEAEKLEINDLQNKLNVKQEKDAVEDDHLNPEAPGNYVKVKEEYVTVEITEDNLHYINQGNVKQEPNLKCDKTTTEVPIENEITECSLMANEESNVHANVKKTGTKISRQNNINTTGVFFCVLCRKDFSTKLAYERHIRTHTGEKPYICNICNKAFGQSGHLKQHMVIHTGERAHACNICNKAFNTSVSLKRHMHVHNGEKPHICNTCYRTFSKAGYLKQHKVVHTGDKSHICNVCNRAFYSAVDLKKHMQTHMAKPFACNACNKCFSNTGHLKQHMVIHTGKRPYACNACNACSKGITVGEKLT